MLVISILLLLSVGYSIFEYALHRRSLFSIPVRIQVNGTRGKSSVTRLIAAGLRAAGKRVTAKTTGTVPMFITGDRDEWPVRRLGKPNIAEQLRIVRLARERGTEVLVLENMSLDPGYQRVEAGMLVRPTHYVVTNVRPDHLDVMGPTTADVGRAFARAMPGRSKLFTAESRYLDVLTSGTRDAVVSDAEAVTAAEMRGFGHVEHMENVALALAVCRDLGVARATALAGMWRSTPDPGALRIHPVCHAGRELELVNALAANDPDSIGMIWDLVKDRDHEKLVLVNCRSDRPDRSRQMADLVSGFAARWYVATGGGTRVFLRRAQALGITSERLVDLGENRPPAEVFARVFDLFDRRALLFCCGNTVGYGSGLIRRFTGGEDDN